MNNIHKELLITKVRKIRFLGVVIKTVEIQYDPDPHLMRLVIHVSTHKNKKNIRRIIIYFTNKNSMKFVFGRADCAIMNYCESITKQY